MISFKFILLFLLSFNFLSQVFASKGDSLPEFQKCVKYCDIISCGNMDQYPDVNPNIYYNLLKDEYLVNLFEKPPLHIHLNLLGWDCTSNCDYQCQMLVTDDRVLEGLDIYQFHGKWPFLRIIGIQELFSTLFSIGNFIPNYIGFKLLWKHYKIEVSKKNIEFTNLYFVYLLVSVVSMFAWFFSTLFHSKDTWNRERLDYLFAGMTVLTGFYGIVVRFFKLYKLENNIKRRILGIVCISLYIAHVIRMLYDWSYTYNMEVNVIFGLTQNFLWVYLSIHQFNKLKNKKLTLIENIVNKDYNWTLTPVILVMSVIFGMSFELFDFPPIFQLIDAHAMWHFVTIWPTIWWYPYMIKDSEGLMDFKFD